MEVRPYIFFSRHTSKASATAWSGSDSSGKPEAVLGVEALLRGRLVRADADDGGVADIVGDVAQTAGLGACTRACPPGDRSRRAPTALRGRTASRTVPSWSGRAKSGARSPGLSMPRP